MEPPSLEKRRSFALCYRKYYAQVLRIVFRIVNNHDICEEIVQEAFIKVLRRAECLDETDEKRQRGFILKVARNCAIDYLRRSSLEEARLREKYFEEAVSDRKFFENVENAFISGEVVSTLRDTIDSFTELKRQVYKDVVFTNRKCADICAESSLSMYKIRKICREVNQALKARLGPYYGCSNDGESSR